MLDVFQLGTPAFMDVLPPDVADKLRAEATLSKFDDGQLIQSRGDDRAGISIVHTGGARTGVYGKDGTFIMATILSPGHTFGELTIFAGIARTQDIIAAGPTEILQISATRFERLHETEPVISRALLSVTLQRAHVLLAMLDALRRLPLKERLAQILFAMIQASGEDNQVRCRREDLAFMVGVSRMSLSKALKELALAGLVQLGYGRIIIPDGSALGAWVAENCTGQID